MANSKNKCAYCKEYKRVEDGIRNNIGFFCNPKHYIEYVNSKTKSKNAPKQGKNRKEKTTSYKEKFARVVTRFNKMRRAQEVLWFVERGEQPTCISCSRLLTKANATNGHFIPAGSNEFLALHPDNSFLQCIDCNSGLSGNIKGTRTTHGYEKGLAMRFGEVKADEIISFCRGNHTQERLTDEEMKEKLRFFKIEMDKAVKEIQKHTLHS